MNLERLLVRHAQANKKWLKACASKAYPHDEAKPLTPREKRALKWAIVWRHATHEIEAKMLKDPEVIRGLVEGLAGINSGAAPHFEIVFQD